MGLLNEITSEISNLGANFTSFNAHAHEDGYTKMSFMFILSDLSLATKIADNVKEIDGVLAVYRAATSKDRQNSGENVLESKMKGK